MVAVSLGDRDDQPQIAGHEHATGSRVYLAPSLGSGETMAKRRGGFQSHPHQATEFVAALGDAIFQGRIAAEFPQFRLDTAHAFRDLARPFDDRVEMGHSRADFLDQLDRLAAARDDAPPCLTAREGRRISADHGVKVVTISPEKLSEGLEIDHEPFADETFLGNVAQRDLDNAVESSAAVDHGLE